MLERLDMAQTFGRRRQWSRAGSHRPERGVSTTGAASGIHPEELARCGRGSRPRSRPCSPERAQACTPSTCRRSATALGEMLSMAGPARDDVDHFVVLGIGRLARGARALAAALDATPRVRSATRPS